MAQIYETDEEIERVLLIGVALDDNDEAESSLDELASRFFTNKFYLTRIFKQVTGGRFSKMLSYRIVGAIIIFSICGIFIKNVQKNKIVKKIIFP